MFENLAIMRMSHAMTNHAVERQSVIARNVANADTPDYKARDVRPFSELYEGRGGESLRSTRVGHFDSLDSTRAAEVVLDTATGAASPNGNTVSLENELMRATMARHEFDTATAIYKSSLNVLRTSIR